VIVEGNAAPFEAAAENSIEAAVILVATAAACCKMHVALLRFFVLPETSSDLAAAFSECRCRLASAAQTQP